MILRGTESMTRPDVCTMRWAAILLTLATITIDVSAISMNPNDYRRLVEARCFNLTALRDPFVLGQNRPVGMSLDYMVSLIRIIEDRLPQLSAKEMITLVLKRFHYDGTEQMGFQNVQSRQEMLRRMVNERIFAVPLSSMAINAQKFPEDALNEDEKCAMFFMVSHTVNHTKIHKGGSLKIRKEFGSVSLANSDHIAVSMNGVLLGIAIGLFDITTMNLQNVSGVKADAIDPLLAVTFADKLAIASTKSVANVANFALFGSDGRWNSSYCQTEYRLDNAGDKVTLAEINGAIDGWLLGRKLLSESGQYLKKLKLSTILDRFYSRDGLTPDCGICAADHLTPDINTEVKEIAKNYLYLWNKLYDQDNFDYGLLAGYTEINSVQFNQFIQKAKSVHNEECLRLNSVQYGNTQCETTTDLFIMLDNNVQKYAKFQLEFVTSLLTKLQSANLLGTATLLTNALRGFESDLVSETPEDLRIPLHLLAYNTSSVQKATCRLAWYPYRETTINNKKTLIDYLVNLFERHNVTNRNRGNSRNFVWLALQDNAYRPLNDREKWQYHNYRWYLKYYLHIRTFFVSSMSYREDDDLNQIILSQEDWYQTNPVSLYDPTIVERLVKKVCETPVALMYDQCYQLISAAESQTYFISAKKKQYWAVYPKYFLESDLVTLQFHAKGAKIRVCVDRWLQPENNARRCKEASGDGEQVQFSIEQPCWWKTIDTCLPIYITVSIGNKNFLPPNDCLDTRCKYINQVQWTVTHSGLRCQNSASNSHFHHTSGLLLMLLCIALYALENFK